MTYNERRNRDCETERIGREFIEQVVFNRCKDSNYRVINEKDAQVGGIDFEYDGKNNCVYKCDLKVAASTVNRADKLHTCCLEILNRYKTNEGTWVENDGWYGHWLKGNSKANTIAILWIDKAEMTQKDSKGNYILTSPSEITEAELCIVKYEDLWKNRLEGELKWTKESLYEQAKSYVGKEKEIFKKEKVNGTIFCSSEKFYEEERPITILIGRCTYRKNAVYSMVYKKRKTDGVLEAHIPTLSEE